MINNKNKQQIIKINSNKKFLSIYYRKSKFMIIINKNKNRKKKKKK